MNTSALADVGVVFVTGLLSSVHCVGMCGPLASLGCRAPAAQRVYRGPWLFVLGKFGSYSVLGLVAGVIGSAVLGAIKLGRATAYVSVVGGVLMLLIVALGRVRVGVRGVSRASVTLARWSLQSGRWGPLFLGVAAALLPCGLLYAMVARSAATAEPVLSMALMQAFGLGTSPALLGIGYLLRIIPVRWSKYGAFAGEVVIVLSAMVLIWRGVLAFTSETGSPCCQLPD